MKKVFKYIVSLILLIAFVPLAQGDNHDNGKMKVVKPYLGHSDYSGGMISKTLFDSLIKQGITAKDSVGNEYEVIDFTFSYIERNLYEDSTGRLVVMSDYLSEYCLGDTLSSGFHDFIYQDNRTKHGDTVYLDKVRVSLPEGGAVMAKSTRFVLTK